MAIIYGKGFAVTACRELLALFEIREEMKIFVLHDADINGYDIARTLGEATRRMPNHNVDVIDLGLTVPQAIEYGLETEKFTRRKALPVDLELDDDALEWFTGEPIHAGYGKPAADNGWTDHIPPQPEPPDDDPYKSAEPGDTQTDDEPTTWEPIDLGPWMNGEITQPQPSLGIYRSDGLRLIYSGREHAVLGETESGKTWLALDCVAAELAVRNHVVYIHYEEGDPGSTIERLRLLDVDTAMITKRLRTSPPAGRPEPNGSRRCCSRNRLWWFTTASTKQCR